MPIPFWNQYQNVQYNKVKSKIIVLNYENLRIIKNDIIMSKNLLISSIFIIEI